MIMLDEADVMLAGGSEAAVSRLSIAGFAIMRALSSAFNADPARASRPWDRDRDGFVLGEGAGVLVLEEREHALRRGARIHGELLGYGLSSDAYHVTAPDPEGGGALLAMRAALARARLAPSDIDYIHAHATSTPLGDPIELRAVQSLFGAAASDISMSASKAATGHLLGAAGALGAVFSLLAIAHQVAPPTRNLDQPDATSPIDLVPHTARARRIRSVLSNSFAFGGANASLIFGPG
jgi:3-oxoacyl-[acyl-carrier-protein] synthase II